jgi:hypothetical protein
VLLLSQTHTVICHEREKDGIYPWSFATQTKRAFDCGNDT